MIGEVIMVTYKKFSDKGTREINEDSVGLIEKGSQICCVLCDGLGGHGRGEEASQYVVHEMLNCFEASDNPIECMDNMFERAQTGLLEEQKKKSAKFEMKTTATMLIINDKYVRWGHIGDSRVYLFKKGKYKKRTFDHSVPQMLVLAKDIKEKEIRNHPDRNKLLRVMGIEWGASSYDISKKVKRKAGMSFLLCSDGFWELIDEKQMQETLKASSNASEWVKAMVEIVRENGQGKNMDNFSAIAVML